MKTLDNTTAKQAKDNVKDIVFWGDGDTFKLISKASSKAEGWMKSTKAMEIEGVGCVVQVTTQQIHKTGSKITELLTKGSNGSPDIWKPLNECEDVTTSSIAEAITFVPGVKIQEIYNSNEGVPEKILIGRKLVSITAKSMGTVNKEK